MSAEVVGAAIASSVVGGITTKVPAKKELKAESIANNFLCVV